MRTQLDTLGVPPELQAFFGFKETVFDYGGEKEFYSSGCHIVPSGNHLWVAGSSSAREVIIAGSVMEIIAMMTINSWRFPDLYSLTFVSVGNHPQREQFDWIREQYRKRKFTLIFPANELGAVADIKAASWLKKKNVSIFFKDEGYEVSLGTRRVIIPGQDLSLHTCQQALGQRFGMRTIKPSRHLTFLDQLGFEAKHSYKV